MIVRDIIEVLGGTCGVFTGNGGLRVVTNLVKELETLQSENLPHDVDAIE